MDESMRFLIEFVTEIKGQEEIEKIKKKTKELGDELKNLQKISSKRDYIKIDTKGMKEIKETITFLDKTTQQPYKIEVIAQQSLKTGDITRIVRKLQELPKSVEMPLPKERGWKKSFTELVSDVGKVKKIISSELKDISKVSGKEARKFAIVWQDEAGRKFETVVKGIVQNKKLLDATLKTSPFKEALKPLNIREPKSLEEWRKMAIGFPREFKKFGEVINVVQEGITTKAGVTTKKFAVYWKDVAGKTYKTFVQGVAKDNKLLNASFKTIPYTIKSSAGAMNDFTKALKRVMVVVPVWFAFRRIFISVLDLIRSSTRFLVDWEQQMARIRIVGMGTEEQLGRLSVALLNIAKNLGVSTSELGKAAVLWAQQGRTYSEIIPLMETTARLSLITGRTMTQSVEDLTAIMKAYKIEAEETGRVIDSLTGVVLKHAITSSVMVEALRNVAPVAKQFNMSMEELMGIITAVHTVTRNKGSSIGRALRTIFARITTNATKTIQEIAKVPVYLDENGKATETATYRMRNLGDILAEIAVKWNGLTQAQKINLAQSMAGKRRLTELMALMSNYDEVLKANLDALFSVGKAQEAVSILTDTFANRVEALSGAWKGLLNSIADTSLMKGSVTLLTNLISGLSNIIDPIGSNYQKFLDKIKESNVELQKQFGIANGILEVWKLARRYTEIFKRSPELKGLEPKYVKMFSEYLKLAGIETDKTISSMEEFAKFMETQIPKAVDKMTMSIHEQGLNKIKIDLKDVAVSLQKLFSKKVTPIISGALEPEEIKNGKELYDTFQKLSKLQGLTSKETFALLQYLRETSKTTEEWKAKLSLVRKYSELIKKLNKEIKDDSKARLEAQTKVNAIVEKETTTMITAEEAKKRILEIEKEALRTNEDRLVTIQKILNFLNQENIAEDDSLRRRKDNLEKEKLRIENQRKINMLKQEEALILERMKIAGANALELEIQRYELMKRRGAAEYELAQQSLRIQRTITQEILNSAESLKTALSGAFSELLKGEETLSSVLDNLVDKIREDIANAFAEGLSSEIFKMTDIGNIYGKSLGMLKFPSIGLGSTENTIANAYKFGADYTYQRILKAHLQGAEVFVKNAQLLGGRAYVATAKGNIPAVAGTLPMIGLPATRIPEIQQPQKPVGFWSGLSMKNRLLAFGMGMLAGMGGGTTEMITSGLSSLFLATGHPLLALGSLFLGGLFRKKQVITRETPKQIAGMQPLNLGIQVPSVPKLYSLPQSFYFNASINVNIDKIQGEGKDIADQIASEVAKATEQAFKQSYVRNITRAVLPKTLGF